jgi:hypothetical protein
MEIETFVGPPLALHHPTSSIRRSTWGQRFRLSTRFKLLLDTKRKRVVEGRTQHRYRVNLIRLIRPFCDLRWSDKNSCSTQVSSSILLSISIFALIYILSTLKTNLSISQKLSWWFYNNKTWLQPSLPHSLPLKTQASSICPQNSVSKSTYTVSTPPPHRPHLYYPNTAATTPGSHHQSHALVLFYATKRYLSTTTPEPLLTTYAHH